MLQLCKRKKVCGRGLEVCKTGGALETGANQFPFPFAPHHISRSLFLPPTFFPLSIARPTCLPTIASHSSSTTFDHHRKPSNRIAFPSLIHLHTQEVLELSFATACASGASRQPPIVVATLRKSPSHSAHPTPFYLHLAQRASRQCFFLRHYLANLVLN